ncbi:MAG: hypothetical protein Q8O30_02150 [Candidatus Omnitrophota bacterium]|nr:hypothetical protein [Candidatus Omnitrophota bacterium]
MKKMIEKKSRLSIGTISILIFFCIGILLRLKPYLCNRSLWLDETFLALNIVNRSFLELLQPLSYIQVAPIGFLMIEKSLVHFFGNNEYALRLFPFLCGVTSLFLFYKVAKHYIETKAIPIAIGLFAFLPPLIYYSSEVKQYSSDVMVTLFLLVTAIYIQPRKLNILRIALFGFIGATAIWFSHPAMFSLAGMGVISVLFCLIHKEWSKLLRLLVVYLIWTSSFIILYYVSLNASVHNKAQINAFDAVFMPFPPNPQWLVNAFFGIFSVTAHLPLKGIAALAFLYGCITAFLKKKLEFLSFLLPMFLVLIASAFHKYPFEGRLLLFFVPIVVLFIAEGVEQIRVKANIAGVIIIGLLFLFPLHNAFKIVTRFVGREEIKPVMNYVKEHRSKGDILYIYYGSETAFQYYAKKYGFDENSYVKGISSRDNWVNYINDLNKLRGNKRVWILFSHVCRWKGVDEGKFFLYHLNIIGTQLDVFKSQGTMVCLYDLSKMDNFNDSLKPIPAQ